jgi:hypothetical protein
LGKLVSSPFRANSRQHAEEIAYRAISSSLSDFSSHLDIPRNRHYRDEGYVDGQHKDFVSGSVSHRSVRDQVLHRR